MASKKTLTAEITHEIDGVEEKLTVDFVVESWPYPGDHCGPPGEARIPEPGELEILRVVTAKGTKLELDAIAEEILDDHQDELWRIAEDARDQNEHDAKAGSYP